jgi:hypothetical protein
MLKYLFAFTYSIALFGPAFANFMSSSDFQSCSSGGEYTVYIREDICQQEKGERCLSVHSGMICGDYDLIDGSLILNPDKVFARELAAKTKVEAEAARLAEIAAAEAIIDNFDFKATTVNGLKSEFKTFVEAFKKVRRK